MKTQITKSEYTYIPRTTFNKNISEESKVIYSYLFLNSGWKNEDYEPKFILPNNSYLQTKLSISRPTIIKSLEELKSKSLIEVNEEREVSVFFFDKENERIELNSDVRNRFQIGACVASYGGLLKCSKDVLFSNLRANLKTTLFLLNSTTMKDKDHLKQLAKYTKIPYETFKKNFYKLVNLGYIDYNVVAYDTNKSEQLSNRCLVNIKVYTRPETTVIIKKKETMEEMVEEKNPFLPAEEEIKDIIKEEITDEEINKLLEQLSEHGKREYEIKTNGLNNNDKKEWLMWKTSKLNKVR